MGPILGGVARMKFDGNVKITCDGNSLTQGANTGTPYPTQLVLLAPLNGLIACANVGIFGQTTKQMISAAADVEAGYEVGKTNILVAWEGVNNLSAYTPRESANDMAAYIAARLASHPDWKVVLITCPPRQVGGSEAADIAMNALIDEYNGYLRNEYKSWGVKVLVDIRQPGSPWAFPNYTRDTFNASVAAGWWAAGEADNHIHYSTQGYGAVASMVAEGLKKLPRR